MIRVVVDTNILIGGAYDDSSYSFKIIQEVIAGRLQAFATHQTMRENKSLLGQIVTDRDYKELLTKYFHNLQIVRREKRLDVIQDKEDNKLFESAVAAKAEFLITNDREVLDVGEYEGVEVVRPDEFWSRYKNDDSGSAWSEWGKMLLGN